MFDQMVEALQNHAIVYNDLVRKQYSLYHFANNQQRWRESTLIREQNDDQSMTDNGQSMTDNG